MKSILKIASSFILLILLNGCVSQNSQSFGQNFDKLDAAKTRVSLGLTYLKNGNFSQAKFNLDRALEFAPRSADANFAMAFYYQSVGELEQAEKAYQFAMDLEPRNANIANSYGAFLCQNGSYEKARKYFLKAVNTSNYISSAETYENLALCSRSQGQPEDAIQYLRSAVNHQPGRANSLFLLARSLVETQQWQEARDILRRYEKTSQVSPQSLMMAMKIENGTGNYVAAKGYSDMLLRIFPNDPITQSWLIEQKSVLNVVTQTEQPPIVVKVADPIVVKNSPKPSVPVSVEKPLTNPVTQTENNDLLTVQQNTSQQEINNGVDTVKPVDQTEPETLVVPEFHVVDKGESLYRISLLYNIKMQRLIDWNSLNDSSAIFVGKKLILSAPDAQQEISGGGMDVDQGDQIDQVEPETLVTPEFHIVGKGENLYRISLLHNIKMQRLIELNNLADSSAIFVGKKLFLVDPSAAE